MPRDADATHGARGRPASRAATSKDPGIDWCPTLADLKNAGQSDSGTASDYRGTTSGARRRSGPSGPEASTPTG